MPKTAITPTRAENYAQWYQQVIRSAQMADTTSVRGCMVIEPWGYAIWENIQREMDERIKATGHKNIYCPLFIPLNHLQKEASHIEGFAKECAVVTHHRLVADESGKLIPAAPLEELLVVRPTSETIIGELFAKWVESYRDLPVLVNQWANVVRWEMRTRLFLRTTEFLWQEGHTAHATAAEAQIETLKMLNVYEEFAHTIMAMPVVKGEKSESERFPGALNTYCIEAMMQDKKALQAGTSHFLGQNFSNAFEIKFLDKNGQEKYTWTTSWGVSTRLIGGLIMTHSDDDGLVLPPRLAPVQVVILPVIRKNQESNDILHYCEQLAADCRQLYYHGRRLTVEIDTRELSGGEKAWSWVKKGVPIRLEIGSKETQEKTVFMGRRDMPYVNKISLSANDFLNTIISTLEDIQAHLFKRAKAFQQEHSVVIHTKSDFYDFFANDKNGFAFAHWCGDPAIETQIKNELKVTIRCLPLNDMTPGKCIFTGLPSPQRALFARAY